MPDLLLHNPRVIALASAAVPLKEDRLPLQRLIGRYGPQLTLGQALEAALATRRALDAEYRGLKARGKAL